jgi:urease accessory protein
VPHRVSHGRLSFQRSGDSTAVLSAYATHPLQILTPRNHGEAAWAYTGTLGGGFVDGDQIRLELNLETNTRAFISTQGPTRIYRSRADAPGGCASEVFAKIDAGAALFFLPDPVTCFAGATFRQHTEIELAETASVAIWEILNAGRAAYGKGERWAFNRYRSSLNIRRSGRALINDAVLLDPAHGKLSDRLGPFDALATIFLSGPLLAPSCRALAASIGAHPLAPGAPILSAASPIGPGGSEGLLIRLASRSADTSMDQLIATMRGHLAQVPELLGDNPWARRH